MALSPELRQRIYEEEKIRLEAQTRIREEIRLREQRTSLAFRVVMVIVFFAVGYFVSDYYLKRSQTVPELGVPAQTTATAVSDEVLAEVTEALKPQVEGIVCVVSIDRPRLQVKATLELARDVPKETAKRLATTGAKTVGATLRKNKLAIPAQVEAFSPKRWYGTALYDSDTVKISWDNCPGRCEEEATQNLKRCRP